MSLCLCCSAHRSRQLCGKEWCRTVSGKHSWVFCTASGTRISSPAESSEGWCWFDLLRFGILWGLKRYFFLPFLRSDFCRRIMLTSDTELGGENVTSALFFSPGTLVKKKTYLWAESFLLHVPCTRACAALAASSGVRREDCPEPGWAGVGGSQCGC